MKTTMEAGTLVLVTDQFACERIIKAARTVADINQTGLLVLSVMKTKEQTNPAALEHLFVVAKEYGAIMTVTFSDDPSDAIVEFVRENRVVNLVTGVPNDAHSMLVRLWKTMPNNTFFTVSPEGEMLEVIDREYQSPRAQQAVQRYIQSGMCLQEG